MSLAAIRRSINKKCFSIVLISLLAIGLWFLGIWEGRLSMSTIEEIRKKEEEKPTQNPVNKTTQTELAITERKPSEKITLSRAEQEELEIRLKKATAQKIILVWISGFGAKVTATVDPKVCGNCIVTQDRNLLNDEKTGAIVLHFDALRPDNVPPTRNPNHLYLFWVMESTIVVGRSFEKVIKFGDELQFNGSYTHRRDADIYSPYGNVQSMSETILKGNKMTPKELLGMKTKLGVAIVSNCASTVGAKKRVTMLKELISHGVLDGYGGCLGGRNFASGHRRDYRHHEEVKKYKFYFSFENSYHCKGYITEKFFDNALSGFAVPVVWGAAKEEYAAIAPPGSFIHAEDFTSMKELADYIKHLDQNDEEYLEYLKWITMKPSDLPEYGRQTGWCQICRALHGINVDDIYNPSYDPENPERPLFTDGVAKRMVKPSLTSWFIESEDPKCFQDLN
uniref:4-galactosyl-N-acetylglucosaminide 3-alpha-L-fucosyltransferase FUT5-like n=1 Tax=Styela clava TaxID=7725 RepID=UPI001939B9B1|nr:4-galactosyl-N-acetylglucosaminide 3-alpha-L-fucosyltransferase FUT5-like [Styela clava]